jgi:hypothetical protein
MFITSINSKILTERTILLCGVFDIAFLSLFNGRIHSLASIPDSESGIDDSKKGNLGKSVYGPIRAQGYGKGRKEG